MNIKSLILSFMLCAVSINSVYAFPMHVDTYRAKNTQEQKLVDKQKLKEGRELAQLGIDLINTVLNDDYEGYRKLVGKDNKKNIPTIMGGYMYDYTKNFEEENKNSFAFLKFLLDITGIKKVELFDANNDYEAVGKRNADNSYKSITTYWCVNDDKLMVPDIRAIEADGRVKINQFALGSGTFSKAKILNAEKNAKKILQTMREGDYQAYKAAFVEQNAEKRLSARNLCELQQLLKDNDYKITLAYRCYPFFTINAYFNHPKTKKQVGIMYFYCDEQGNIKDIDNKLTAADYKQQKLNIVENILRAQYVTGDNEAYQKSLAKYNLAAAEVSFTPKAYLSAEENILGLHFNTNKTELIRLVDMGINMTRAEATVFKAKFEDGSTQNFIFVFDDSLLQPKCVYWEAMAEPEDTALNTKLWWEAEKKYKNNPDKYAWRHRVL